MGGFASSWSRVELAPLSDDQRQELAKLLVWRLSQNLKATARTTANEGTHSQRGARARFEPRH